MICQCGNQLKFTDNSLNFENGKSNEVWPVYYCNACNIVWNGYNLDLENEYNKMPKKYIKWFK